MHLQVVGVTSATSLYQLAVRSPSLSNPGSVPETVLHVSVFFGPGEQDPALPADSGGLRIPLGSREQAGL